MKKHLLILLVVTLAAVGLHARSEEALFPPVPGLENPAEPARYSADNLFEYINGAADVFIGYDFEQLFSMTYSGKEGQSIIADIYRHADPACGFGIYSQEKPRQGDFLNVGTEGYYESGVLNFFLGRFYVKIAAFDLGADEKEILIQLARGIAERIPDSPGFPPVLNAFPQTGRIPHSEHFIRRNFLGHGFLENAFTSDYDANGARIQPFIIQADSSEAAANMVADYLKFARSNNVEISENEHTASFADPYHSSRGPLTIQWRDNCIWGIFTTDSETAASMLAAISTALREK